MGVSSYAEPKYYWVEFEAIENNQIHDMKLMTKDSRCPVKESFAAYTLDEIYEFIADNNKRILEINYVLAVTPLIPVGGKRNFYWIQVTVKYWSNSFAKHSWEYIKSNSEGYFYNSLSRVSRDLHTLNKYKKIKSLWKIERLDE